MKTRVFLGALVLVTTVVFGDDIRLPNGKTYYAVAIASTNTDVFGIIIKHAGGSVRIAYKDMSATDQAKFSYKGGGAGTNALSASKDFTNSTDHAGSSSGMSARGEATSYGGRITHASRGSYLPNGRGFLYYDGGYLADGEGRISSVNTGIQRARSETEKSDLFQGCF